MYTVRVTDTLAAYIIYIYIYVYKYLPSSIGVEQVGGRLALVRRR
jgi:hypothetical protein